MSTLGDGVRAICDVKNIANRLGALTPKLTLQPKLAIINHLCNYGSDISGSVYANFTALKYPFCQVILMWACLGNVLSRCSKKATKKSSLRDSSQMVCFSEIHADQNRLDYTKGYFRRLGPGTLESVMKNGKL